MSTTDFMGTDMLSGIPVEEGDAVYFIPLRRSHIGGDYYRHTGMRDIWQPVGIPVYGTYAKGGTVTVPADWPDWHCTVEALHSAVPHTRLTPETFFSSVHQGEPGRVGFSFALIHASVYEAVTMIWGNERGAFDSTPNERANAALTRLEEARVRIASAVQHPEAWPHGVDIPHNPLVGYGHTAILHLALEEPATRQRVMWWIAFQEYMLDTRRLYLAQTGIETMEYDALAYSVVLDAAQALVKRATL